MSQADKIMAYMEHQVQVAGEKSLQAVADELQAALQELTPKRTGKTAASWTQEKQDNGDIHIVTRLQTKKGQQPARYIIELNEGTAERAPTRFIQRSIAQGLQKARDGGSF